MKSECFWSDRWPCIIVEPTGGLHGAWKWSFRWKGFGEGCGGILHIHAPSKQSDHEWVSGFDSDLEHAKIAAEVCAIGMLKKYDQLCKKLWDDRPGDATFE